MCARPSVSYSAIGIRMSARWSRVLGAPVNAIGGHRPLRLQYHGIKKIVVYDQQKGPARSPNLNRLQIRGSRKVCVNRSILC